MGFMVRNYVRAVCLFFNFDVLFLVSFISLFLSSLLHFLFHIFYFNLSYVHFSYFIINIFIYFFIFISIFFFFRLSYADPNSKKEYWFNHLTNEGQFDMPESVKRKQDELQNYSKPNITLKTENKIQVLPFFSFFYFFIILFPCFIIVFVIVFYDFFHVYLKYYISS